MGRFLHFLAVFVGAGHEQHIVAIQAHEARDHITGQCRICVTNVGFVIDVINWRRDVIGLCHRRIPVLTLALLARRTLQRHEGIDHHLLAIQVDPFGPHGQTADLFPQPDPVIKADLDCQASGQIHFT